MNELLNARSSIHIRSIVWMNVGGMKEF